MGRRPLSDFIAYVVDNRGKTPPLEDSGIELIEVNALSKGQKSPDYSQIRKYVSVETYDKWFRTGHPKIGDVLITTVGAIGRVAYIKNVRGCIAQNIISLRPDQTRLDGNYLYYYMVHPDTQTRLLNLNIGVAQPSLKVPHLLGMEVVFPALPIQRKIAAILSAYDDLIENNTRRIEILEEMARSLYREWFVNFRFPGHDKTANNLPNNWILKKLGDIVADSRNAILPTEIESTTPYVGLEHIPRRSLALTEWGHASDVQSTKLTFKKGDILFGKIRPYFHKVIVAPFDGVCSTDAIVITAKSAEWFPLILMTVFSDDFVNHATQTSNGTKMPRANWDVLLRFSIPTPPDDLLNKFNGFTNEIINQITNLISKNRNLRETRNLLLPKLISGEIDVCQFAEEMMEVTA